MYPISGNSALPSTVNILKSMNKLKTKVQKVFQRIHVNTLRSRTLLTSTNLNWYLTPYQTETKRITSVNGSLCVWIMWDNLVETWKTIDFKANNKINTMLWHESASLWYFNWFPHRFCSKTDRNFITWCSGVFESYVKLIWFIDPYIRSFIEITIINAEQFIKWKRNSTRWKFRKCLPIFNTEYEPMNWTQRIYVYIEVLIQIYSHKHHKHAAN